MTDNHNLIEVLNKLLSKLTISDIAKCLGITVSTINRWVILRSVPSAYCFALLKLDNTPIDYSQFSYKEKDQFFTPKDTAKYCCGVFYNLLQKYKEDKSEFFFIEPSAGSGNFLHFLPPDRTIAMDIEPKGNNILTQDYLCWKPEDTSKKFIVIGNPPFGLRGQLALQFINHSAKFAEYVCFILPQLFESDGKGVPRKRVHGFHLIHSERLDSHFIDPNNTNIVVNCILQIWSKYHKSNKYEIKNTSSNIMRVYSLSDGGTPSSTRNKNMINACDVYLPSTCFGKENMKCYMCFDDLPSRRGYGIVFNNQKQKYIGHFQSINWGEIAFLSTNSAYNLRTSQIINCIE